MALELLENITRFFDQVSKVPYPQSTFKSPLLSDFFYLTLNPLFPLTFVLLYVLTVNYFNAKRPSTPAYRIPKWVLIVHNLSLAIYSAITWYKTGPMIYGNLWEGFTRRGSGVGGFRWKYCDAGLEMTDDLMGWAYIFYLSKYWEILDTIIILVKGKKASALQEYHHAGAMLTMWSALRYRAFPVWIFCVFNSFIHAMMYTYYAICVMNVKIPKAIKQALTSCQITQFIVGGSIAFSYLWVKLPEAVMENFGSCLKDQGQQLAVWLNVIYLTPLTWLFTSFFISSYVKKRASKRARQENSHFVEGFANGVRSLKVD